MCYKNIYEYAYKAHLDSLSTKWFTKKTMQSLLEILWYKEINKNIVFECNDISHISWNHTVASRSIIENWKSNTSKYKKFKIKTLEEQKIDDFNSMREVITRRLKEIDKLWNIPDLIIIDGWKWQLSSVVDIIKEHNYNIQIVWIAKREEELFLPWNSIPILLNKESNELRLVQKIRDEAHRFAITFNRDSRIKSMKKNILEELPWFWPKTRKKILNKYWSIDKIKWIWTKELETILNKTQIETLENHWLL
jgi:excinuclease ABC subunit C